MQIQNNNKTNFGINILNKPQWSPALLKTLEESTLCKEIDAKYPEASVKYTKQDLTGLDLANDDPDYLASMSFYLSKGKISTFHMNSHTPEGADSAMNRYISTLSLEEIEQKATDKVEMPKYSVEIRTEKKQNPVARFFSNIFG